MDLNKIRSMNDEELLTYLKNLAHKDVSKCTGCGNTGTKVIKIENKETFQTKKLCGICDKCYIELLNYLKCSDINWK